jgi:hypothetical protein
VRRRRLADGNAARTVNLPSEAYARMRFITVKRWTLLEIWARTPRIALATFLIFSANIFIANVCWADEASTKSARILALNIAQQLDHTKKLNVEIIDMTGEMPGADLVNAKEIIETELRGRGFHIAQGNSYDLKIRFTLSRDNARWLWIADYENEGAHAVVIVPFERLSLDVGSWLARAHVDRELVFSGNSPILDFACTGLQQSKECGQVLVLYRDRVVLMSPEKNFPGANIGEENPPSRDLRGRLKLSGSEFEARIQDMNCPGKVGDIETTRCSASGGVWRFSSANGVATSTYITPSQNWFSFVSAPRPAGAAVKRDGFFSIAGLEVNGEPGWVSSGTDGKTRIFTNKNPEALGTAAGWGTELATVKTMCSNDWQILATRQRDRTEEDAITVYEWTGAEFRALTDPLEMDGSVVVLWSAEDGGPARAVVHNLKTGNYEAYLLKVGCSQ